MEILTCCAFYYFLFQLFTNPKLGYVKEKKPQTGTDEPVSAESSTWGAPTTDEGEEKEFIGKGVWF